jgi:glycosyltransferase involved in cell wall biosynthesis
MSGSAPVLSSFAVVVPMFNEEKGAERCVREIVRVLASMPHRTTLIAVNDGSSDSTAAALQRASAATTRLEVITHPQNRGYGAALATGSRHAAERGFDYALFMDSDLTNSPDDIPRLAESMSDEVDVIKATRYSKGGSVQGVPFYRLAISSVGNRLARVLFRLPIHDCTNGFRAVRTELLRDMRLSERGFAVIMEELYWCRFMTNRYTEVPVVLTNRCGDQRPTSFVYRPSVFWRYLKYPLRAFAGIRPGGFGARER